MSSLSHSVKFSDQPYSQNQKFQVHVPELDEAPLYQGQGQNERGNNYHAQDDLSYQNNGYRQVQNHNNYSTHQSGQQNLYSPHYSHHARMQQQQDIEKQFNYSGSRLRSPHHNPASKVESRLRQGMNLDSMYNQGQGYEYHNSHNHAEGEHCPTHCPHPHDDQSKNYSNHLQNYSVNGNQKNQSKVMRYAQPFGSGKYSNQLQMRTAHSKTANNFFNNSGNRKAYTSQESRRTLNGVSNSTTFNSLMQNKKTQEKLREKLYFDERTKTVPKTTIKNGIIENIVSDGEVFTGNKDLLNSVFKLKSLNLLKQHESHVNRYNGVGKFPFVFNDYHSKSTNNGYSRQEKGGFFFTK